MFLILHHHKKKRPLKQKVLLITPPFTQLNTPYPATAYLKGFLDHKKISSTQIDLGLDVLLNIFSKSGLTHIFEESTKHKPNFSENAQRIFSLQKHYINTVHDAISFLQGKNEMLAHTICNESFLPQASRFNQLEELDWAFGNMGIRDKARHLCTLFLEDLCDFIVECIDPYFGFSRYAERISSSALIFDPIYSELNKPNSYISETQNKLLSEYINNEKPTLVAFSVPFPGNLFAALKCGQFIKFKYPDIKICIGGGYPNTELRSLSDPRIFEFIDYITLDDGETPLLNLIEHLNGERPLEKLKRTLLYTDEKICYFDESDTEDFSYKNNVAPNYSGLKVKDYISVIEIINPMHRLWSDGFWNKLTMAHGCYWAKCTFCDTTLDYIKRYEPVSAEILCNKVEDIIKQTGNSGFHFVDEAAPPALMVAFAKEVLKRGLNIAWWTNIRFEKQFTFDVCRLLKASGCIAVSGGLEVASERILKLINKGVSISTIAETCYNFTSAGILTHAYLMYGFPTQTQQETIDSLEVVRQLFENNILHSGYWHQFAMTAHSPVGQNPEKFNVKAVNQSINPFANNDLEHIDNIGAKHELFSEGLKKSLYNFMHDIGFDLPLHEWFEFKVPPTNIAPDFIYNTLQQSTTDKLRSSSKILWINEKPVINYYTKKKKGKVTPMAEITIHLKNDVISLNVKENIGNWIMNMTEQSHILNNNNLTFNDLINSFQHEKLGDFNIFRNGYAFNQLRECGLLIL